ncbi:TIR domain-containing anti-phage reverse transcriptase [Rhizobium sp. CECT 9324]|uniref:TIR domain-containing anti-phage reverse transcriptase n=1 Tax=Rhizobium sp. CECT 9324 TaxID=2845820 RepID=UPI001E34CCA4|nr:TIR domain-containing anti-phage reverse transcriptase [Rhizobium sp. CECT 9324]CAH0340813.1 hypothetical protein RHI9324_02495 [Rhizobium sp. CECT 9324]
MSVFDDPITKLRLAHSVQDVAFALNLDPAKFFYVIQNSENGSYYKKFEIPKKSGGVRQISRPLRGLALAQDRLSAVLTAHYKPKSFVKGYIKGESFFTNAKYHERQKWVLNLDIKDFFPSIHFGRVRGLFISQMFGFNEQVSTVLARIVTFENGLPQGASTSPIIANIIANNLDKQLIAIAAKERLRYTRYADDITFSSSQKTVPSALIKLWEPDKGNRQITLSSAVHDAFRQSNFAINEDKVRIQFPYERQEVTGLIVNKKANVWRRDVSKLRMKIHAARKHGAESAAKIFIGESADGEKFWQHITGWLAYVRQIRGNDDPVVAKLCKQAILAGLNGAEWIRRYADMVREFDIFLSHASEDKEKVRKLKDKLEGKDVRVFFDESSISWGDSIVEKINHGLLKSLYFVPVLSETFAKKGWTNKELNSAIQSNIGRKGRILPIVMPGFSVAENYPLLNETLYRSWPAQEQKEGEFLEEISDQILLKIQKSHHEKTDLG